ncbi:hypothetical protein SAMN05216229_12235 [Geopseudomonas sagittaria]|uniref:Uncharacterized protein n=1 Tax=Geopseudomonas sagittaria TaxID=1135990 RepID=A0A1I5YM87_9GAMM|nr:hypothetical protein [Pseudomonas sagittaria]SFQ45017.1 hypothetical protein SAMN05216229_12235 [Pseudomonas sagittaria]
MNRKAWLALMVAAVASQSYGMSEERGLVSIELEASPQNTAEIGRATLVAERGRTAIVFALSGAPSHVTVPLHYYTYIYPGSCKALGAQPAYDMNNVVRVESFGHLSKRVPVALEQLRGGNYSIVVRSSPADGRLDLFCGEII